VYNVIRLQHRIIVGSNFTAVNLWVRRYSSRVPFPVIR